MIQKTCSHQQHRHRRKGRERGYLPFFKEIRDPLKDFARTQIQLRSAQKCQKYLVKTIIKCQRKAAQYPVFRVISKPSVYRIAAEQDLLLAAADSFRRPLGP